MTQENSIKNGERISLAENSDGPNWIMSFQPEVEIMPSMAVEQGVELLNRWSKVFPGANTWVAKTYGVPSLFVRLDCVVDGTGNLRIYEVEERPCGIGMTAKLNPVFKERFDAVARAWPSIRWVRGPGRETDDALYFGRPLSFEEAKGHDGKLLVRSRPEDLEFHCLEDRAVSSVSREGDKMYGLELGLWDEVKFVYDPEEDGGGYLTPPIHGVVVLKPRQGTRSRDVRVFAASTKDREELRKRVILPSGDFDTLPRIVRLVGRQPGRTMYCQKVIEPMRLSHQPDRNAIYRLFYAFCVESGTWKVCGGVWMALNSLIVHGTDKTVTGALVPETR